MAHLLPLAIFPEGALASSVVTCVWVGVAVVVFFNLRFGWVLSGLVVPGYLVPLLLVKPLAAAVIAGEGIATYGLVWLYSEFLSKRFGWSNFFGRDRFFALVLTSVVVRVVADGFLLPALGAWLNDTWHLQLDYRNDLHSFGLIIVALIANTFWKSGLRRGALPLALTVLVTLLIVRFGLMTLTNFNISSLAYVYEPMAETILASPKAYVILLATAFLASRLNLLYGWDFAGILIPSLLALQWYEPTRILVSFAEATIILVLVRPVLRLPVFHGVSIEGGRKLLLFFNISYLYKLVLAWLILHFYPEQNVTDLYGFGYLLPTLIAVKMHEKEIFARLTASIVNTSIAATICATVIGFGLSLLPAPAGLMANAGVPPPIAASAATLVQAARSEKVSAYRTRLGEAMMLPTGLELDRFRLGVEYLATYRQRREPRSLQDAARLLGSLGYVIEIVEDRFLLVHERASSRHWGFFALDLRARANLAVEVPAPLDERGAAEAGVALFRALEAQSLAIAGATRNANEDGSADVLANSQTPYQIFHEVFAAREALQVRGASAASTDPGSAGSHPARGAGLLVPKPALWAARTLPDSLDLAALAALIGDFELNWGKRSLPNVQRDTLRSGFAELRLNGSDLRRLLAHTSGTHGGSCSPLCSIESAPSQWLLADKSRIASSGTGLYRKAALEELLFFDEEVLTPLLHAVAEYYRNGAWTDAGIEALNVVSAAAATLGYELRSHRNGTAGSDLLILAEAAAPGAKRYWGTYVLRLGTAEPFLIQVPRPVFEVGSLEFGVSIFDALHARALLVAGAVPDANPDRAADILSLSNKENLFNVVNQALLRHAGDMPLMVLQSRAMGVRPELAMPAADIVIGTEKGALFGEQATALGGRVVSVLERYGLSYALSGDTPQTAGYEAGGLLTALYLSATKNKEFTILWVSPLTRAAFREPNELTAQQAQFQALGVATLDEDIGLYVIGHGNRLRALPASLRAGLAPYFSTQDIVVLHAQMQKYPTLRFERVLDSASRQGFLAVLDGDGVLLGLANLTARVGDSIVISAPGTLRSSLSHFVEARAAWLIAEGAQ